MQTQTNIAKNAIFDKKNVSVPNALHANKVFASKLEVKSEKVSSKPINSLAILWNNQHPLIHTWLLLSSVSICFLFAVFFVIK